MTLPVSVLFAREDSIYKGFSNCDVWDIERDALQWTGGNPVITHPPCRAWGRLRRFSKPRDGEKELALWAVEKVRLWGGVLEHPAESTLWTEAGLPNVGQIDEFGGYTIVINQSWFGHKCEKKTWLYIVGCEPENSPTFNVILNPPTHCIRPTKKYPRMPSVTHSDRERTPPELAKWLVSLASRCVGGRV